MAHLHGNARSSAREDREVRETELGQQKKLEEKNWREKLEKQNLNRRGIGREEVRGR